MGVLPPRSADALPRSLASLMRDPASDYAGNYLRRISAEELVKFGTRMGASVVASTYNEPLITSEWAKAVFNEGSKAGMVCVYVSNGNATPDVLEYLQPGFGSRALYLERKFF